MININITMDDESSALQTSVKVIKLTTGAICLFVVIWLFFKVKNRIPSSFIIIISLYTISFVLTAINVLLENFMQQQIKMISEGICIIFINFTHAFITFQVWAFKTYLLA